MFVLQEGNAECPHCHRSNTFDRTTWCPHLVYIVDLDEMIVNLVAAGQHFQDWLEALEIYEGEPGVEEEQVDQLCKQHALTPVAFEERSVGPGGPIWQYSTFLFLK